MLNKTLLCTGVCLAFSAIGATDSNAAISKTAPSVQAATAAPVPSGAAILFTQTGAAVNGVPAQNFETLYDAYDSEAADDFTVPAGGWAVSSVNFAITGSAAPSNPATATWNITFYSDSAGAPGAADAGCTYTALAATGVTATGGTAVVALPTQCTLTAGVHWFSAQSNLDATTDGQTFWRNFAAPAVGASAVFRNPNDGFGTGCTTFMPIATCAVGGSNPNLIFQLLGQTTPVTLQSYKVD